ncbi:MAG: beta-hydroxyacyl-ACP dehydratase [Burkholderiales bacterium]
MKPPPSALPPIETLIPHRGRMLWLERLVAAAEDAVEAAATVPAEAGYLDPQPGMPAWLGIELMAQAVAAHAGLRGWREGKPPKPGVLLGCRRYQSSVTAFAPGAKLRVSARLSYRDEGGFGAYDCTIADQGAELASATLKVYEPPDFEAFLKSDAAP